MKIGFEKVIRHIDTFLPDPVRTSLADVRRGRILILLSLMALPFIVELISRIALGNAPTTVIVILGLAILVVASLPLLLIWSKSTRIPSYLLIIYLCVAWPFGVYFDQSMYSNPAVAAPVLVLCATFLLGYRAGLLMTLLTSLCFGVFASFHIIGIFPSTPIPNTSIIQAMTIRIASQWLVFILAAAFENSRKASEQDLLRISDYKSQFLANMSHDIRTPLNSIIGLTEVVGNQIDNDPELQKIIQTMTNAGNHLLYLVNDILDYSYSTSGKVKLNEIQFGIRDVIEDTSTLLKDRIEEKGVQFSLDIAEKISQRYIGDPNRLQQILLNLLTNAIKYTDQGEVSLKIGILSQQEDRQILLLKVKDSGIGISKDRLKSIFNDFSQAHNSLTVRKGGVGLGLAITKSIVEVMGGEISAESQEGHGTTFIMQLPFKIVEDNLQSEFIKKALIPPQVPEASILFVDDNPDNIFLIEQFIKKTKITPFYGENGEEACEMFLKHKPDVVYMDMQMPVMDGYTALQTIRKMENDKNISRTPLIGLSAFTNEVEIKKCFEAGCDDYLTKPLDKSVLLASLKKWIPK